MKKMFFIPMLTGDFIAENKNFENIGLEKEAGPIIFLECGGNGETIKVSKIRRVWQPIEIINRFNSRKPTFVFPKK